MTDDKKLTRAEFEHLLAQRQKIDGFKNASLSVMENVFEELYHQREKFGDQNHKSVTEWLVIEGEELGEANRAAYERDWENYREEMIQVAAVAVAAVIALDSQKLSGYVPKSAQQERELIAKLRKSVRVDDSGNVYINMNAEGLSDLLD